MKFVFYIDEKKNIGCLFCSLCNNLFEGWEYGWENDDYVQLRDKNCYRFCDINFKEANDDVDELFESEFILIANGENAIDYGMIWCDSCGARVVLDPFCIPQFLTFDEVKTKYLLGKEKYLLDKGSLIESWTFFELVAAHIDDMVDSAAIRFICPRKLNKSEVSEVLKHGQKQIYGKEYDINDLQLEEFDIECHEQPKYDIFNLSSSVDSVNLCSPKEAYPEGTSLAHDGQFILLRCTSPSNGKQFEYLFSGD